MTIVWTGFIVKDKDDNLYVGTMKESMILAFKQGIIIGLYCGLDQALQKKFSVIPVKITEYE